MKAVVRLTIELVPRNAWCNNLRSLLPSDKWDRLRKETYRRVNYCCEICGGKGPTHPVECHEKWEYDDKKHIATLVGLLGLCPACHETKHMGLAQLRGRGDIARKHLAKVNGITDAQARKMIADAFRVWHERDQYDWTTDIGWAISKTVGKEKYEKSVVLDTLCGVTPRLQLASSRRNRKRYIPRWVRNALQKPTCRCKSRYREMWNTTQT